MCSSLVGSLARSLPIGNGLSAKACLSVVMRQELRLSLDRVWETLLKYPSDALVAVLAARAEQRLISDLVSERVLESIFEVGKEARFIEELGGL
jgi:hypothetical protein